MRLCNTPQTSCAKQATILGVNRSVCDRIAADVVGSDNTQALMSASVVVFRFETPKKIRTDTLDRRGLALAEHTSNSHQPIKYQRWYDHLVARAQSRKRLGGYSEVHHIEPRSLGGSDQPANLVSLTYREHFLAHWLLTKIHSAGAGRRMQRALFAMTLQVGKRAASQWQLNVARSAVRDLEVDPEAEALWQERLRNAEALRAHNRRYKTLRRNGELATARRNMACVVPAGTDRAGLTAIANEFLHPKRRR
ncbi:MAG: hypothetical protein JWM36_1848 [Hyphomicrobiales bacterium]|nr:hypothetical protein [Hyphomicrobiales bacterium]